MKRRMRSAETKPGLHVILSNAARAASAETSGPAGPSRLHHRRGRVAATLPAKEESTMKNNLVSITMALSALFVPAFAQSSPSSQRLEGIWIFRAEFEGQAQPVYVGTAQFLADGRISGTPTDQKSGPALGEWIRSGDHEDRRRRRFGDWEDEVRADGRGRKILLRPRPRSRARVSSRIPFELFPVTQRAALSARSPGPPVAKPAAPTTLVTISIHGPALP